MLKKIGCFLILALFLGYAFALTAQAPEPSKEEKAKTETALEVKKGMTPDVQKWIAVAAGFGVAIAAFGGALGQGRAISAAVEGIARNPGASGKVFMPMIVGLVLIETLVIYSLLIALLLYSKI